LSREGIHYAFAPHFSERKVVSWRDIDGFGIARVKGSDFNCVRLARYENLLRQFTDGEAMQIVKFHRHLMRFAGAMAIASAANLEVGDAAELAGLVLGGGAVASLAAILRFNRQKYGGEICLSWADRDRSAANFTQLLTAWSDFCAADDGESS